METAAPVVPLATSADEIEKTITDIENRIEEFLFKGPQVEGDVFMEEMKNQNTDKELQKLKRGDLLEVLLEQSKEKDSLQIRLEEKERYIEELNKKLEDRRINLEKAGTIAEASFKLNGVFEAAEKAAEQYLENLQIFYEKEKTTFSIKEKEVEDRCNQMLKATQEQCEKLIEETEYRCSKREREAEEKCLYLDQKAKSDVDKRWGDLSSRLEEFYNAHEGLRELLASSRII
jgi:hypothetical protein